LKSALLALAGSAAVLVAAMAFALPPLGSSEVVT